MRPGRRRRRRGRDPALVAQLVAQAREQGLRLSGDGGLSQQLRKVVLEAALDGELTERLGYDRHDPAGANSGNSGDGSRAKDMVSAKGLTTGGISAHLAEVYGAQVSERTVSTITEKVTEARPSGGTGRWTLRTRWCSSTL